MLNSQYKNITKRGENIRIKSRVTVTEDMKREINRLHNKGRTNKSIARVLNICVDSVLKYIE